LTFILILLLSGCATVQPNRSAVYHSANETWTVENTTPEEFCKEMIYDPAVTSGVYFQDNTTIQWQNN
jgi:uncharacterized protein YceK